MKRLPCRPVSNPRNSRCMSARLRDLDFSNWWTDGVSPYCELYIHVQILPYHLCDDTVHRVFPKHVKGYICKRLRMVKGVLCWLYDEVRK